MSGVIPRATWVKIGEGSVVAAAQMDFAFDAPRFHTVRYHLLNLDNAISAAVSTYLRTSSDGGATFDAGASDYAHNGISYAAASATGIGGNGQAQIPIHAMTSSNGANVQQAIIDILAPDNANINTQILWNSTHRSTTNFGSTTGQGRRLANGIVNGIRLLASANNITANFVAYGLVK